MNIGKTNLWKPLPRSSKQTDYVPATLKQVGFIVGTGRCGTTILGKILNAHAEIVVPHELQIILGIGNGDRLLEQFLVGNAQHWQARDFIQLIDLVCPYHFEEFFDYPGFFNSLDYPQTDLRELLLRLFDAICADQGKRIFLEQTPWYGQRLDVLKELFSDLKVIHIVRDGRDVALSFARTPWWSKDVAQNLAQWAREVEVICSWGAEHPDRYLEVRYEDFVSSPMMELERVCPFLGLEPTEEMLCPDKLINYDRWFKGDTIKLKSVENQNWDKQKHSSVFSGSVGSWKKSGHQAFTALPQEVARRLVEFGYSWKDSWKDCA